MRAKTACLGLLLVAVAAIVASAAGPTATAVVCTEVKERAPVGAADSFPASVGKLFCFSELRDAEGKVAHIWFQGDKQVFTVELPVKGQRWRTWSAKRIPANGAGPWRVEVRTTDGTVLATATFTVQ